MAYIVLPYRQPARSFQETINGVNPEWLSLGLSCAYVLTANKWKIDQVTQKELGSIAGTGPTFPNGWLRNSSGTAGNGALLPHNLATPIAQPISFVWGEQRVLGSTLGSAWSLMTNSASYTGWWSTANGHHFGQSVNGTIDVAKPFSTSMTEYSSVVAVSKAANNVYMRNQFGYYNEDLGNASPGGAVTRTDVAIGWFRANTNIQNATNYEYTHFIVFQSALSKEVAYALALNPWQVFKTTPKVFYFFVSDPPSSSSIINTVVL